MRARASSSFAHAGNRHDRPEALLAHDRHAVVDVDEHGRFEPVAGSIEAPASAEHTRPLTDRVGHLGFEHIHLRGAGERADVGGVVHRVVDAICGNDIDDGVDDAIEDAVVYVHALDRAARLAAVVARAFGDREGGVVGVDVVAHVRRVLAAELQLQSQHAVGDRLPRRAGRSGTNR